MTNIEANSDADLDLRDLFRRTAPVPRHVDVEALCAAVHESGVGSRLAASRPRAARLAMRRLIAASVTLVVAVGSVAVWFLPRSTGDGLLFAEVQERVAATETVTFNETERRAGRPDEVTRMSIRGANLLRADLPDGNYSITDFAAKRSLLIDRQKQRATLIEGSAPLARNEEPINLYDRIRNIRQEAVKPLPERTIDGKPAAGFLVSIEAADQPHEMQVWVDPETKLPVRFEQKLGKSERISSGFRFDVELDETLFAFQPPEGYELQTLGVASLQEPPNEKSVAEPVVTPLVGIGPAKFGMSKDEIIRLLGEPDRIISQEMGNGSDQLEYYSRGYGLHVSRKAGFILGSASSGQHFAVQMRPFAGRTDKGIRIGVSEAEIRRAYGDPSSVDEPTLKDVYGNDADEPDRKTGQKTLYYDELRAWFSLQDGELYQVMIRADVRKLLEEKELLPEK